MTQGIFPERPAECTAKMCPHQEFLGKESKRKRAQSKKKRSKLGLERFWFPVLRGPAASLSRPPQHTLFHLCSKERS